MKALIEHFNSLFIRPPVAQRLRFSALSRRGPMRLTALTATEQLTQPALARIIALEAP
ncbi:hypothetical protein [Dactylosporangium maewongense]